LFRDPELPFSDEGSIVAQQQDERETRAIYGQLTYNLTDKLSITGGVRYTEEDASLRLYSVGPAFTFFGPEVCRLPDTPDVDPVNCIRNMSDDYDAVTYNVSLDYRISEDMLVYITSRRGFNAGGFNSGVPVPQGPGDPQPSYEPEYIRDYEIGVKADWQIGEMTMRTNLSVFHAKYEDIQRSKNGISAAGVPYIGIATGPEATVQGLQFESAFLPVQGLQLNFNYGYLDTQYDKGAPGFLKGNAFAQAPEHTVNLSATYSKPVEMGGEIYITAGYTYQSEVTFQDSNIGNEMAFQKGYELFDARLGWTQMGGTGIDLSIYGKNLNDEAYALERQDQRDSFGFLGTIYNDPRTYGIELRYNFGQ
jgi:iron complex outermembrane receptor protein